MAVFATLLGISDFYLRTASAAKKTTQSVFHVHTKERG
jgi:hypothetical protein